MRIGVVREIKDKENRVSATPEGVAHLVKMGSEVAVEQDAGQGSGFSNDEYKSAGAKIVSAKEAWDADLVIKVKEPLESEYPYLKNNILFTYLHLAGVPLSLTKELLKKKTTAIAYETVEDQSGRLPLLAPMSAVAGNMAVNIGSYYLAKFNRGRGIQLGTVLGKRYGKVVIIGDGVVGRHAAAVSHALGAKTVVFGIIPENGKRIQKEIGQDIAYELSTKENISSHIKDADLVIGAVLLRGAKAPYVITEDMVRTMREGAVMVDVSIDQGGCIQTSRPTSHSDPVFIKHGVIHYCVTNMPGAYPRTSTIALTSATLPYVAKLAKNGLSALKEDPAFAKGLNTKDGSIISRPIAEALKMMDAYRDVRSI